VAFTIPSGQRVDGGGAQFATTASASVGGSSSQASLPISATSPGAKGNVPAGQITQIEFGSGPDAQAASLCLTVNNPSPTAGGADEKRDKQLSQADWDNARTLLSQQLTKQVTDELNRQGRAGEKLSDKLTMDAPDFNGDHHPGDLVSSFSASMSLKGEGAFYKVSDVNKAVANDLEQHLPRNYQVTDNSVHSDYQVVDAQPGGRLTFHARAAGYMAPKLDNARIKGEVAGKSPGRARAYLKSLPVRSTELEEHPFELPLMPFFGSRIDLRYVVEQGPVRNNV
jgi:hypothetical protein